MVLALPSWDDYLAHRPGRPHRGQFPVSHGAAAGTDPAGLLGPNAAPPQRRSSISWRLRRAEELAAGNFPGILGVMRPEVIQRMMSVMDDPVDDRLTVFRPSSWASAIGTPRSQPGSPGMLTRTSLSTAGDSINHSSTGSRAGRYERHDGPLDGLGVLVVPMETRTQGSSCPPAVPVRRYAASVPSRPRAAPAGPRATLHVFRSCDRSLFLSLMWLQRGWTWFVPGDATHLGVASGPPGDCRSLRFFCFRVRRFGEPFDRAEPPVPSRGEVSHGPGGLVRRPACTW